MVLDNGVLCRPTCPYMLYLICSTQLLHPVSFQCRSPAAHAAYPTLSTQCTTQHTYRIFRTIRHTISPKIWEENWGVSYSLNVAYIYIGEILCYLCY